MQSSRSPRGSATLLVGMLLAGVPLAGMLLVGSVLGGCMSRREVERDPVVAGTSPVSPARATLSSASVQILAAPGGAWLELRYSATCTQELVEDLEILVEHQRRPSWVPYAGLGAGAVGAVLGFTALDHRDPQVGVGDVVPLPGPTPVELWVGSGFLIGSGAYLLLADTSTTLETRRQKGRTLVAPVRCVQPITQQPFPVELALDGVVVATSVEAGGRARFWIDGALAERLRGSAEVGVVIAGRVAGWLDLRAAGWPEAGPEPPGAPPESSPGEPAQPEAAAPNPEAGGVPTPPPASSAAPAREPPARQRPATEPR